MEHKLQQQQKQLQQFQQQLQQQRPANYYQQQQLMLLNHQPVDGRELALRTSGIAHGEMLSPRAELHAATAATSGSKTLVQSPRNGFLASQVR